MNYWETINGITGIVSATAAVISLIQVRPTKDESGHPIESKGKHYYYFILACSGWVLGVMCWVWIFEPFGPYVSHWDQKKVMGIALSFPAISIFLFGLKKIQT